MNLIQPILELYKKCATDLPSDVEEAIAAAQKQETADSPASNALKTVLENIKLAREEAIPICQDTGIPMFYVNYPAGMKQKEIREQIVEATKQATKEIPLRPNAVDTLSGKNTGDNKGDGIPASFFEEWDNDYLEISLMLKGGGSENIGQQYKLTNRELKAARDIEGIKKCVIDAMFKAQGRGCSPNIIGVAVGGTKDGTMWLSKKLLLNKIGNRTELEQDLFQKLNSLGIGPLGLGGKTTVLDIKFKSLHRHPASFFVAVSFMCWAARRYKLIIKGEKWNIE